MKIVLASQSPRRKALLEQMGLTFTMKTPNIDEKAYANLPPELMVEELSKEKALQVAKTEDPDTVVIGADTVVLLDDAVLGKPADEEDAVQMLTALSDREHIVCTGLTVVRGEKVVSWVEGTKVYFHPLSEEDIQNYVRTGEPMDKAGAYGIQGYGAFLVEGIEGDYSNVVGLPIHRLGRMLKSFGVNCLAMAGKD